MIGTWCIAVEVVIVVEGIVVKGRAFFNMPFIYT